MTFDGFEALALQPPYINQESIYRVDIHCSLPTDDAQAQQSQFMVKPTKSYVFPDLESAESKLRQTISSGELADKLYAVYIYQLPIEKNISCDLYQRLWVYDCTGKLNGQSRCSTIVEDLDHPSSKFRGHDAESIRFKPGDIVEVYDREKSAVFLASVIEPPLSIEQCWQERDFTEKTCIIEGLGSEFTDDNYPLYANDDCYHAIVGPSLDNNRLHPRSHDVFAPTRPISPKLRAQFDEYYRQAVESINHMREANAYYYINSTTLSTYYNRDCLLFNPKPYVAPV